MSNNIKKNNDDKKKSYTKWVILITLWAFMASIFMSFFSDFILRHVNLLISFFILILIILIGIIFDIVGVAVAAAEEKPFHSMASAKIDGSFQSIKLIRNASKVSNICNDVVGDICGVISGASAALIIVNVSTKYPYIDTSLFSILLSGLVASFTIGGKAIGKEYAMTHTKDIIKICGKIIYSVEQRFTFK